MKSHDADGDDIFFKYKWTLNEKFAGESDYLDTDLKRDDTITVEITPYDNEQAGKTIKLTSRVYNSLPVYEDSQPSFNANVYEYQVTARDPDGDELTFTLEESPESMIIDSETGKITWEVGPEDDTYQDVKVRISDNNGGELIVPFTTSITFEEAGK